MSRHVQIALLATLALVAGYPSILVAAAQTTCQGAVDTGSGSRDHAVAHSVHATLSQARRPQLEPIPQTTTPDAGLVEAAALPACAPRWLPLDPPTPTRDAVRPPLCMATTPRGPPVP